MNWIPFSIICAYVILLFTITWLSRRLSRGGMVAYLLAGRSLPYWVIAPLLTGLAIGGASTIGVAERAYKVGLSAGWYNAAWAVGALLVGLFAAHKYRQLKITTLPELFERHYSVSGRVIGVIGQLVPQIVITSLQYVAGGAILSSLLPEIFSFQTGMLVTAIVFVMITLIGGFWAAGLTNIINVTFIYAGVILGAIMAVSKVGGLSEISVKLPDIHPGFDLTSIGWGLILAWFVVMCTTTFAVQSIAQISFAAKDSGSARKGFILGGAMILPVGFISAVIGVAAAVAFPDIIATEALPRMVLSLSPFVAGIILAGLWAADVSTASALLIGSATLVVGDIIKRFIKPDLDEKKEKLISRISVIILSVLTYILAVSISGILKTLLIGLTLTTAYTLITLMTIFWPKICRRAHATWTLIMAMAALAVWLIFPQTPALFKAMGMPHPIFFCWIVSILTFGAVALIDKRKIELRPSI